ncbi:phosphotransferase enzyme family-domain-containing protein [Boeremia exigua]|uniref:phosphotransferase enzyme family-domain-containing protein n=1 Tax=Boeremia exigua TaxID=749465 RepID=UPI001E8D2EAF|nr:phosphotransferase enzyme family-domain-containing protein [Boeremia exigua]KAH6620422.1 phosphotransferase enzyme family-domain-containing protein [Boeremia exigua]
MSHPTTLEWTQGTFGLEPTWPHDPDLPTLIKTARPHLDLPASAPLSAVPLPPAPFSRLYALTAPDAAYVLRVSLPADPGLRTASAAATLGFVSQNAEVPVPRVLAFEAEAANAIGYEWTLTSHVGGAPLYRAWRRMSWDAKTALVKRLAGLQADLSAHTFQRIGGLYAGAGEGEVVVGELVAATQYQGDRVGGSSVRGPFASSHAWLKARLEGVMQEQRRVVEASCDEDEIDDAVFACALAVQLEGLLGTVFLAGSGAGETTALSCGHLSMHGVWVDGEGRLTGVVDWEGVPVVPVWRAGRLPVLFEERVREEKPVRGEYAEDSEEEDERDDDGLDNEGVTDLYWEHLLEWEITQLREVFVQEMEERQPGWTALAKQNKLKDDFERAVEECGNGWRNKSVKRWADALAAGTPIDLTAILFSSPEIDQVSDSGMDWEEA